MFSPVEGTVYNLTEEWAGTQTWIQSSNYPAFFFILFHVDLTNSLALGDSVAAGEQIGTHIGDQTTSDIAVGVNTPTGWKLISFFDVMTEALFAGYTNRGVMARSDLSFLKQNAMPIPGYATARHLRIRAASRTGLTLIKPLLDRRNYHPARSW